MTRIRQYPRFHLGRIILTTRAGDCSAEAPTEAQVAVFKITMMTTFLNRYEVFMNAFTKVCEKGKLSIAISG